MREQIREVAKDGNADNPYEENPRRMIIGRRQFTPLQSFIVTVDILFLFRILYHFLECFVFFQISAASVTVKSRAENTKKRSRNGDGQNLEQ